MKTAGAYIALAIGCGSLGVLITFIVLFVCHYFRIDISKNLWVIAIPILLSIFLNILFIEVFFSKKKK
jgi:H+/Cl- antiporter ClcA